jgi:hypothetical protein
VYKSNITQIALYLKGNFMSWFSRLFSRKAKKQEPQNRVFLAEDPALKQALLDIVRDDVRGVNRTLFAVMAEDGEAVGELIRKQPDSQQRINDLVAWPRANRSVRERPGLWVMWRGPEIILSGGEAYLSVPDAGYLERRGGDFARLGGEIRAWTPAPGLREQDPLLFGARPVGLPRVSPHEKELKKAGLPRVLRPF